MRTKFPTLIFFTLGLAVCISLLAFTNHRSFPFKTSTHLGLDVNVEKVDVLRYFIPSGWMGDGEDPQRRFLTFDQACKTDPHSGPVCIKVSCKPGPKGWAAIYWQNKPNNWCMSPGNDYSKRGFTKITFWVKGEEGGELVEFKSGGIVCDGKPFKDSYEATSGAIPLEKEWIQYSIDLAGTSLESVIGGFCWTASASSPITFYIDDVFFE